MYQSRANSVRNSASTIACTTKSRRRLFSEAFGRMKAAATSVGQFGRSGPLEQHHQHRQQQGRDHDVPEQGDADDLHHLAGRQRVVTEDDTGEREHRGGHERAHGHCGQPGQRAAASVGADTTGQHGDQHERQRPAPGDVVGGRSQVEQHPGQEAHGGAEGGTTGDRGGHHDDQCEVRDHAVDREEAEHGGLQGHGEHDDHRDEAGAREVHRVPPWPLITSRSPWVLRGTTTPTTSSEVKSTKGSITACLASSRGVEYTDSTFPIGMPATYGTPFWLPHVTTTSPLAGVTEWSTRSSPSRPRSLVTPRPRRKPISLLEPRRPPTTESVSRMSSTSAVDRVALMTRPTSPSLLSTVMSLCTPEEVPASMVTVREKDCIGPMPTTRDATSA